MKKLLAIFALLVAMGLPLVALAATPSLINYSNAACLKDGIVGGKACSPCELIKVLLNGADILVGLSGTLGVIMIIYGGFVLITAYGNSSRIQWGKDAITAAVIGIIIIMLAWTLVNLIMASFFSVGSNGFQQVTGKAWTSWNTCESGTGN